MHLLHSLHLLFPLASVIQPFRCAKMCRAKISFLKQVSDFYAKPENGRVRAQNGSYDLACSDQASNVHPQLRFMAGIWTIEQTPPYIERGFLMNKLLSCRFNMDTNRVEARFKSSTTLAIDCIAVEDEYGNTPAQRAELDWLLYNKPLEYAQMVLGGEIRHYLSLGCDHCKPNN